MAMVQGAVYGAGNAVDRHGRPYLVSRSFPMAAKDAAAATAAFLVLDTVFTAQHATLKAAYDASLLGIPDGPLKDNGIRVGTMAADAMLAEGHDGRTPIGCTFGSGPLESGSRWAIRAERRSATRAHGSRARFRFW